MVRDTSIKSYHEIVDNGLLSKLKMKAYVGLYKHGPCTAMELFDTMGWKHGKNNHNVSSRLGELRDRGVVHEVGKRVCRITGMQVIVWDVTSKLPIEPPRRLTNKQILKKIENSLNDLVSNLADPTHKVTRTDLRNDIQEILKLIPGKT